MLRRVLVLLVFGMVMIGARPALAARRVRINVESTPPGATVYVDSESSPPLGVTPIRAVLVPAGAHVLIFKKDSYETAKLNVNVRRWRETFRAVLNPLSTLVVTPVNDDAQGATLVVDGQTKGPIPWQGTLQPGRHFIQVTKDGYNTYGQWQDLQGGQQMTVPIMLEKQAPKTGSILVAGNKPGATIFVDGQAKGVTPTVIDGLSEGEHVVEVHAEGMKPFQKTVTITAGQRVVVNANFEAPPSGGSLRIVTTPPGAVVSVDGEAVGQSPVTKEGLAAGDHLVEATADGYQPAQTQVTVVVGTQKVVSLQLQGKPQRIVVNANVDDAKVMVDGEDKGPAPVVVDNAAPGTHAIVVRATGYQEFRTTCEVGGKHECTVNAELKAVGTPVRVEANVTDAEFFVDGKDMGPVPFEGTVPAGSHRIEVRAPGYQTHVEQVLLEASSETRDFNVALIKVGAKTPEELAADRQARLEATREAAAYSAAPLPQDMTVVDVSLGWPFIAEGRMSIGILPYLEAGFAMRTFGRLTEFEGRAKAGYRPVKQVAVGGQVKIGGGIGPTRGPTAEDKMLFTNPKSHPTNDFFFSLEGMASLHFSQAGAFTMWAALDLSSDRWDFQGNHKQRLQTVDPNHVHDRQNTARLRIGGSLEILINRHWNVFGVLEGIVAGPDRRIFGDVFGLNNSEPQIYGRLGFTYKFGLAREEGHTFSPGK